MQETRVRSTGQEDLMEREMATHPRTSAWETPWTEEPGRLQSMGWQRVRHDLATDNNNNHLGCSLSLSALGDELLHQVSTPMERVIWQGTEASCQDRWIWKCILQPLLPTWPHTHERSWVTNTVSNSWTLKPCELIPVGHLDGGVWWAAVHGVAKSQTRLRDVTFPFHFHALEKETATHFSVLAWRIPGTGECGGLQSMKSLRVRHDWSDLAAAALYSKS